MAFMRSTLPITLLFAVLYVVNGTYRPCGKCAVSDNKVISSTQPSRHVRSNSFKNIEPTYDKSTDDLHVMYKREAQKPESMASLKKRLLAEKMAEKKLQQKQDNTTQHSARGEIVGWVKHRPSEPHYGSSSSGTRNSKSNNLMLKLVEYSGAGRPGQFNNPGTECNFELDCRWTWKPAGFVVASSYNLQSNETGPQIDADNKENGHFLLLRVHSPTPAHVTSPLFSASEEGCRIKLAVYQEAMRSGIIRIILHHYNNTQVVVDEITGDDSKTWHIVEKAIGKTVQQFSIILEVVSPRGGSRGSLVAFDNIKLTKCFPEGDKIDSCTFREYRCSSTNRCINNSKVCDISKDCKYGDDENQNCDKVPHGARCSFEQDWCGWTNEPGKALEWTRHHGSPGNNITGPTGPSEDHTEGNTTGKYLHVTASKEMRGFANIATLRSVLFNPPPRVHGNETSKYYNSCTIRFYLHQADRHKSGLMLQVTELRPKENISIELLWSYHNFREDWVQQVVTLPNITYRYYLHFDVRTGVRYIRDIAIDDFSLSPECFGLNIPDDELNGYNYYNPEIDHPANREPHRDYVNKTFYDIRTCGQKGRYGPTVSMCQSTYNNTKVRVKLFDEPTLRGVQKWTVPSEGYYTFILYGAGGGKGSGAMGSSRGAMIRVILELRKGQEIYMVVGQEGADACVKSLGYRSSTPSSCESVIRSQNISGVRGVLNMDVKDGGGGGGGASYIFVVGKNRQWVPIAVAAGGGGLGLGKFVDSGMQHGQAVNASRKPVTGEMNGVNPIKSAGAGGGWTTYQGQIEFDFMGQALIKGGFGGKACYNSTDGKGNGGFGGGGGGCTVGGGGGGYAGGNAWSTNTTNGEGGYSFIDTKHPLSNFSEVLSGYHAGSGSILIIPAISGCGCNYRCLALDAQRSQVACICPRNWKLDINGKECLLVDPVEPFPPWAVSALIGGMLALTGIMALLCVLLYNRYQHRAARVFRRKGILISGPDLQLNRLRIGSEAMITEYNPNYEFEGMVYSLRDLKEISRKQLRLVKALGQGAFGEVYKGFYRHRSDDAVEMPVAVKTLPEMCTGQGELDFLMEALIMSKFSHPNIVHFIGACFDKHPRFIVLELLVGGDLKAFLRESRPRPDVASLVTMKDLLLIAVDIASGCRYLERNRFIHRDLAARNCLLTTKGPGRCVKIADFGMSRDIYRADYYRKGGKAMLPIKWMPPEAFLDGLFTIKTDVWSFGVVLWEIMSMGYMPYTGLTNQDVMQLVADGGRLEPPANCPGPIYGIMTQCWHPIAPFRPTFLTILERLGYCMQDPQVMEASLPIFYRLPSRERDATIMRPNSTDDVCLQVPQQTDYLIPNHKLVFTTTVGSTSSVDRLLADNSDSWETSFTMPHSGSTQPLIPMTDTKEEGAPTVVTDQIHLPDATQNGNAKQPISISNHINSNNNCANFDACNNTLKSGLSLDAGALIKQTVPIKQKKTYANVGELTGNGVIGNGSYSNANNYVYSNNANKFANESEISC